MSALAQQRILVTRPAHQAHNLCALIVASGGIPIVFPVIDIQPITDNAALAQCSLNNYDLAIFISANAVQYALPILLEQEKLPTHLQLAAVGKSTAKAMTVLGCAPQLVPAQQFNSEGLLMLPELQEMQGKRVVIFRGEGGRELLAQTLRERGAELDYVNVYCRRLPVIDKQKHSWLANGAIDNIILTSGEGLQNLRQLLENPSWLAEKNWVVMSERLVKQLRQAGMCGRIEVARRSDDEGLLQALKAL